MSKRRATSIEHILERHSPEIRDLVEQLRALMRETVPDASEAGNAGWHSINYRHPDSGYFCGIFPQDEDVLLAFEFGVLLSDPDGVLEGKGTQVRFVRVRHKDQYSEEDLTWLMKEAARVTLQLHSGGS